MKTDENNDDVQNETENNNAGESNHPSEVLGKNKPLDTLFSTKTGTKIFKVNPIIVFENSQYFSYIKARNKNKNEKLPWEIELAPAVDANVTCPNFLRESNYLDLSTIFKMEKEKFLDICKHKNIEYAQIDDDCIKSQDRLNIVDQLLINLSGKQNPEKVGSPDVVLIFCDVDLNGETSFRVDYCPIHYLIEEKELLKNGILVYEFELEN